MLVIMPSYVINEPFLTVSKKQRLYILKFITHVPDMVIFVIIGNLQSHWKSRESRCH